jgi:hypothetical protein
MKTKQILLILITLILSSYYTQKTIINYIITNHKILYSEDVKETNGVVIYTYFILEKSNYLWKYTEDKGYEYIFKNDTMYTVNSLYFKTFKIINNKVTYIDNKGIEKTPKYKLVP